MAWSRNFSSDSLSLPFLLGGVVEDVFERVVLRDEFLRGFFADAGHAGDVVGGVAPEAEDVAHLVAALDAPLGEDFGHAENFGVVAHAARGGR